MPKDEEKVVKPKTATYIGTADVRIITGEDLWRAMGIKYDGPALVWHAGNRFALPVEELPSEVVDHLLDVEPDIVVEDGVPERLLKFMRAKVAATSVSGRIVGRQALAGREEFAPAHPESTTLGEAPVISPEVAEAAIGGGVTTPVTTVGGRAAASTGPRRTRI
jgi:hypothetical protein